MNTFVIELAKIQGRETSKEIVDRHISHLRKLDQEGRLVLCGPFTDHPSGLVIVKASDKEEARQIASTDPFVKEGVRSYTVKTWLLANRENNFLG